MIVRSGYLIRRILDDWRFELREPMQIFSF